MDDRWSDTRCHDPYLRCALYGAAQVALGIKGCCVLAHSPQGCFQLVDAAFGWQDADYTETVTLCTKLCEDEIVYGGEALLARTILEAREFDVPVLFVLTACGPEIVGDDIAAVCTEVQPQVSFQLVPIQCAGFRGDQNRGADIALSAILDHLVPTAEAATTSDTTAGSDGLSRFPRSVVLVAPHANANPTWMGDLRWVEGVLAELGATVLATLTHNTTLEELRRVPAAEGALLLSHDTGEAAIEELAARYGIERWCADLPLPIGFTNTEHWLTALGWHLGAEDKARELIARGEGMVVETCRRKGLEQSGMHRAPVGIVADATIGLPLLRFLSEDLEMIPELICLRSAQPAARALLQDEIAALNLAPKVVLDADVYAARSALAEVRPEMVFGSNIERHAIEALGIPFPVRLLNPISRNRMTDRAYFGYTGMLNLIEEMQNDRLDRYRSRHRRYQARW